MLRAGLVPKARPAEKLDHFHMTHPADESGYARVGKGDEDRFRYAKEGDVSCTTFQCNLCIFQMLTDGNPVWRSERENMLLCCIRRLNLDALQSREPGTIYGSLLNVRNNLWLWDKLGINSAVVLPRRNSFSMQNIFGLFGGGGDAFEYAEGGPVRGLHTV